jgi:hypothetical protein
MCSRPLTRKLGADVSRIESGSVAAREVALEGLHVFAGTRRLMVVRNNQGFQFLAPCQLIGTEPESISCPHLYRVATHKCVSQPSPFLIGGLRRPVLFGTERRTIES